MRVSEQTVAPETRTTLCPWGGGGKRTVELVVAVEGEALGEADGDVVLRVQGLRTNARRSRGCQRIAVTVRFTWPMRRRIIQATTDPELGDVGRTLTDHGQVAPTPHERAGMPAS